MALGCVAAVSLAPSLERRIPYVLAALWAWMGVAYQCVVFVVPLVWSAIGASVAFALGVVQDVGLLAAGLVAVAALAKNAPRLRINRSV